MILLNSNSVVTLLGMVIVFCVLCNPVNGQTEDKTFKNLWLLVKMNYSSDWTEIKGASTLESGTYDYTDIAGDKGGKGKALLATFCPTSELPSNFNSLSSSPFNFLNCMTSPIFVRMEAFRLPDGTSLKQFIDGEIKQISLINEDLGYGSNGGDKVVESKTMELSGVPAYTIVTTSDESEEKNKVVRVYTIKDGIGHEISFHARTTKYFDHFYPTFQHMLDSFKIIDYG